MLAAVGVTGITRAAIVNISRDVIVLFSCVPARVANGTGKLAKITRRVTLVAIPIVRSIEGETVVEIGLRPARVVGRMAQLTIRRKPCSGMVGIACASVVLSMASKTIFR